jgi:hypothetical protein
MLRRAPCQDYVLDTATADVPFQRQFYASLRNEICRNLGPI